MKIDVSVGQDKAISTEKWLARISSAEIFAILDAAGQAGVAALAAATPSETGATAMAWTYEVVHKKGYHAVHWRNTNVVNGIPIAVILEYGHGTRNGGYVQGQPYIMSAVEPIFQLVMEAVTREVKR